MRYKLCTSINILLVFSLVFSLLVFAPADPRNQAFAASAKKPKYIAHRGWSSRAPENTLAALKLAAKNSGFYGVEFDVWESAKEPKKRSIETVVIKESGDETIEKKTVNNDPLLLVMHDENIKRMCGVSKGIRNITRANRSRYSIIRGSNIKKYRGQNIPTFDEAIEVIYENSKGAIPVIELKHRLSKRALKYLLQSLAGRRAVIISFDFDAVADVEKKAAKMDISDTIQTMYVSKDLKKGKYASTIRKMKAADIDCISLKYTLVSKRTVRTFHKAEIKVCIWTVPNKKIARKYADMGVDYITSNGI